VFDLPVRPAQEVNYTTWHIFFSSLYQINQITHGKGIATGYVSRNYPTHPLFGHFISENFTRISPIQADMTVDGRPSSRYANLRYDLATNNYRYVVLHKPSAAQPFYPPGSWGEQAAERLIQDVFGAEPPLIDDAQMRVHEVGPAAPADSLQYSLALLEPGDLKGWWQYREAAPGTGLLVHAPVPIAITLGVKAQALYDPAQGRDSTTMYDYALLTVESGSGAVSATVPLRPGEEARVPVALSPGRQVITMTVTTSEGDPQPLMPLTMVINRVDLATDPAGEVLIPAPDAGHATAGPGIVAAYADGWYAPERGDGEGVPWRWASSPAALWVYSGESITATLRAIPVALHVPGAADGKGPAGELTIRVNGGREEAAAVTVGQPLAIPLRLEPGWNEVTLALAAGNFRPLDVQPDTGDGRQLSFALTGIDISP
jgi:hypothetical protein